MNETSLETAVDCKSKKEKNIDSNINKKKKKKVMYT